MIDLTYLNDITGSDTEAKRQLITLFLEQQREIAGRFRKAQEEGDIQEIGRIAHLAKSTSRIMGIAHVSDSMQELQHLVDGGISPESYDALVDVFYKEMPVAIDELNQVLESL